MSEKSYISAECGPILVGSVGKVVLNRVSYDVCRATEVHLSKDTAFIGAHGLYAQVKLARDTGHAIARGNK
ncbi:hypothetical protein LCGC14_2239930, partial [marine sediment metagenome]